MTSLRTEIEGMKRVFFDVITKVQSMSNQNAEGMNENQNGTENTIHRKKSITKTLGLPLRVMRSKIFFSNRIELSFEDKTQRKEIQNLMEYTLYQSLFII